MSYKSLSNPEKWILKGVPALFLIGSLTHFMYAFFGKSPIAGLFFAVNESIWEHSKMVLLPMILWWSLYFIFKGEQYNIDKNKWFGSALVALLTALISMPMLYYFYTGAFGVELLWVDIIILFLVILFGQLLGLHFYNYGQGFRADIVILIFVVLILMFMYFTFYPPNIPLFQYNSIG